ncbi:hypothetical protein FB567DRAFT_487788 [Paraphoma chrysanthemicola]|uniref:NAD(P)-binding protein n=1 Tax=Paraphoma chrysanthemicola TaxID=798071 RepID=A0A8K0RIH0_9PLEO|nr:hypothetical protein FB567DRAFT_487788 [Paraphoma chrysanthemicola]
MDIPDLAGKVILVTGGNSGLGRESVLELAKHNPSKIYLASRNAARGIEAIDLIKMEVPKAQVVLLLCDLSSLQSVQQAAQQIRSDSQHLDILICNAGVVACPKATSKDGYEIQFATNHLGHALLIKLLIPLLFKAVKVHGDAKVVSIASPGFNFSPKGGIQFNTLRSEQDMGFGGPPKRYGQSKLANILYADELARRYPELICISVDPGAARTELFTSQGWVMRAFILITTWMRGEWMWSAKEGAYNQLWAATATRDDIPSNGGFYKPIGKHVRKCGYLKDHELREMLWEWTQNELEEYEL